MGAPWSPSALREELRALLSAARRGALMAPGVTEALLVEAVAFSSSACATPSTAITFGLGPVLPWFASDHELEAVACRQRACEAIAMAQKADRDKDEPEALRLNMQAQQEINAAALHEAEARRKRGAT